TNRPSEALIDQCPPAAPAARPPSTGQSTPVLVVFGRPNLSISSGPKTIELPRMRTRPNVSAETSLTNWSRSSFPVTGFEPATESSTQTRPSAQRTRISSSSGYARVLGVGGRPHLARARLRLLRRPPPRGQGARRRHSLVAYRLPDYRRRRPLQR